VSDTGACPPQLKNLRKQNGLKHGTIAAESFSKVRYKCMPTPAEKLRKPSGLEHVPQLPQNPIARNFKDAYMFGLFSFVYFLFEREQHPGGRQY
jgi:hypothetical protein